MPYNTYNECKQRQTKYSFFYFSNEANKWLRIREHQILEFLCVLSKFPRLKRSIFRIAMSILLQFYPVDKSYTTYICCMAAEQLAG